jgi:hypothetical protein
MKAVSIAGLVVIVLIVLSLAMAATERIEFSLVRGIEYIVALLLLDAAQDADKRGDDAFSVVASLAAVFVAFLTLL